MKSLLSISLLAALLAVVHLAIEGQRRETGLGPGDILRRYDDYLGVWTVSKADGSEEVICRNGVRRPLLRTRRILTGPTPYLEPSLRRLVDRFPSAAFPLLMMYEDTQEQTAVILSLMNGETFRGAHDTHSN